MARYDSSDAHAPRIMPYRFVEFPRMLHAPDGRTKTVRNEDEKKLALSKGWLLQPVVKQVEENPDPIDVQEVASEKKKKS